MDNDALRAPIRETIARHLVGAASQPAVIRPADPPAFDWGRPVSGHGADAVSGHPSQGVYARLLTLAEAGACQDANPVHCTQCGFCRTHGF